MRVDLSFRSRRFFFLSLASDYRRERNSRERKKSATKYFSHCQAHKTFSYDVQFNYFREINCAARINRINFFKLWFYIFIVIIAQRFKQIVINDSMYTLWGHIIIVWLDRIKKGIHRLWWQITWFFLLTQHAVTAKSHHFIWTEIKNVFVNITVSRCNAPISTITLRIFLGKFLKYKEDRRKTLNMPNCYHFVVIFLIDIIYLIFAILNKIFFIWKHHSFKFIR